MTKDDKNKQNNGKKAEDSVDEAFAQWGRRYLEANPPKGKAEFVSEGGSSLDKFIDSIVPPGVDQRQAEALEAIRRVKIGGVDPTKKEAKFRSRREGESEDAYIKARTNWQLAGMPELSNPNWDKLRAETTEFMKMYGGHFAEAIRELGGSDNRDLQLRLRGLVRTMEKVMAEGSSFDDLKPIHTRSLDNGDSILRQVGLMTGNNDITYAAMEYEASDRGDGIALLWKDVKQQRESSPFPPTF